MHSALSVRRLIDAVALSWLFDVATFLQIVCSCKKWELNQTITESIRRHSLHLLLLLTWTLFVFQSLYISFSITDPLRPLKTFSYKLLSVLFPVAFIWNTHPQTHQWKKCQQVLHECNIRKEVPLLFLAHYHTWQKHFWKCRTDLCYGHVSQGTSLILCVGLYFCILKYKE